MRDLAAPIVEIMRRSRLEGAKAWKRWNRWDGELTVAWNFIRWGCGDGWMLGHDNNNCWVKRGRYEREVYEFIRMPFPANTSHMNLISTVKYSRPPWAGPKSYKLQVKRRKKENWFQKLYMHNCTCHLHQRSNWELNPELKFNKLSGAVSYYFCNNVVAKTTEECRSKTRHIWKVSWNSDLWFNSSFIIGIFLLFEFVIFLSVKTAF